MAGNFVAASSQYIDLTAHVASLKQQNGSLSIWLKTSTQTIVPFSCGDNTSNNRAYIIIGAWTGDWPDESVSWFNEQGGIAQKKCAVTEGHAQYADGSWHHYVVIMDGVANKIIVDGDDKTLNFVTGNLTTANVFLDTGTTSKIGFGKRFEPGSELFYNGAIGDTRIYSDTLTPTEAINIYEGQGSDGIIDNLVGRWNLDESVGGSAITAPIDIAGGAYDGSPSGSPTYTGGPFKIG